MKKLVLLFIGVYLLLNSTMYGQIPQRINYQAVARNTDGSYIANKLISLRISIIDKTSSTTLYVESHIVNTSNLGLFNLAIGAGNIQMGEFKSISWSTIKPVIQLELDITGGNNFILMGQQDLQSVPYALSCQEANTISPNATVNINQLNSNGALIDQILSWNGTQWTPKTITIPNANSYTSGQGITINNNVISAKDTSANNEIQSLSLNNNVLSISKGNSVTLPTVTNLWNTIGNDIKNNNASIGSVIIGIPTNSLSLDVKGISKFSAQTGLGIPALEVTNSGLGSCIYGNSLSNAFGVIGVSSKGTGGYFASSDKINSPAILAQASGGPGIYGHSINWAGVQGISDFYYAGIFEGSGANPLGINVTGTSNFSLPNSTSFNVYHNAGKGLSFKLVGYGTSIVPDQAKTSFLGTSAFPFASTYSQYYYAESPSNYFAYSDKRLKKNIFNMSDVKSKLMELRSVRYDLIDSSNTIIENSKDIAGFIAQEMEVLFPDLVKTNKETGIKAVSYVGLIPYIVKTMQEQEQEIIELKKSNDELKKLFQNLKNK